MIPIENDASSTMNHGNNNNNHVNANNNQRWRSRSGRYNRYPNGNTRTNTAQPTMKPQMKNNQSSDVSPMIDAFGCSTDLVNSIKQVLAVKHADRITPADSPVGGEHNNGSPIHHRQSNAGLDSAAALWQMDFGNWSPRKFADLPPYPKCIPTLNGSPYIGGPSTSSPSPVGSSRGSTYSNSSPPQVISGGSSPMMSDYFPPGMNGGRRCSAEEMLCKTTRSRSPDELLLNLHDINRASSSQSPENNYNVFQPIGGMRTRVDSRLSDDVNYAGYYPTCRSSESRSSEDLSIEHIMGEFRTRSPDSGVGDAKRHSNSSGSTKCNECTMDRACDNCNDIYATTILANAIDLADSNQQDTPLMQEISSAMTVLDIVPYSQKIPRSNQLALPAPKQMVLSNRQLNNIAKPQQQPIGYPVASQLALSAPSEDKPLASSSPLIFLNQRVMSDQPILYCSIHNGAQRFYCQTCSKLFCNECGPQHHVGHVTVHLLDATESAQKQAEQVITECRFSMATIREDIDKGVIAAQTLDAKACEAVQSVRDLTRRLTEALRVRERELIEIIESTRKSKQQALQTREEGLKFGLSKLSQTIEKLNRSVEASSLTSNPFDLYTAKDTASAQVFHIKAMRNGLPPPEDHYIKFQVMDAHIVDNLRTLGNISTGNGHIGDRRVLTRHGISSQMAPPMPVPRGRAISGANFTVSITNNRITPNGSPYLDIRTSVMSIGGEFTVEENLCRPWGVACDRDGHIVIADRSNNRIQIFRASNGSFVRRFGSHGTGRGQFDRPAGIAVDARRRIVVADKDNHRIQILTMEGEFLMAFGEKGTTPGLFNYPWDVATNDACQIVVSDTRNHRIQLFSPEGVFLRKFGFETQPQLWKCLDSPRGVAFTNEGNVLVTDFNNHRIVVVDADFLNARFLGCDSLSPHPLPPKTFLRPQGIAVDDNGHIIVCDSRNHRVQILDNNGVCRWRFGTQGIGPSQLDRPSGVAVTPDGKIVVVDFGNNRVLVF